MATEDEAPQRAASTEEASGQETAEISGTRLRGVVKWFNASKGFGFIQPEDSEAGEVFVHQTSIDAEGFRSLLEGEAVEFEVEVGDDGRRKAVRVTGPEGRPVQGVPRRAPVPGEYGAPLEYGMMAQERGYGGYPGPPMPMHPGYITYMGGFPAYPQGPGMPMGGRGGYGQGAPGRGFGRGPPGERRPPPGTPGVSSGLQVVVHNLPWSCTWQMLKDVFSETPGVVRADVIIDSSGRSRGFGTVRYSTPEEAQHSVELMNNVEIGGRTCSVRIDRFA